VKNLKKKPTMDVEALYAQVYAHPEDDAPRAVLADQLQALGDPRGEFIALQLQPSPSPENLKRQAALLRKHLREWLGPLDPVIPQRLPKSTGQGWDLEPLKPVYRRGFLAAGTPNFGGHSALMESPAWATLEELWGGPLTSTMRSVRVLWFPRWQELVGDGAPCPAVELHVHARTVEDGEQLAATERLNKLRILHLHGRADWLAEARFAPQLEVLEIMPQGTAGRGGDAVKVSEFVTHAPARFPALRSLGLRLTFLGESSDWLYRSVLWLSRDAGGEFTIGRLEHSSGLWEAETFPDGLAGVLQVPLRELTVTSTGAVEPELRAALVKGAQDAGLEKLDLTSIGGKVEQLAVAKKRPAKRATAAPRIDAELESLNALAFAPDGRTLFAGKRNGVLVFDTTTWEVTDLRKCEWPVEGLAVSERLVAASSYDQLILWDRHSGKRLHQLRPHTTSIQALAFSADGAVLASGARNGTVTIIDPVTGTMSKPRALHRSEVLAVALSPDGQVLATASLDGTGLLFDLQKRRVRAKLESHTSTVSAVEFSPDGMQLATGAGDGTLRIWSAADGKELHTFARTWKAEYDGPMALQFSNDGQAIFAAWKGGDVTRHDTATLKVTWRRTVKAGLELVGLGLSPDGAVVVASHANGLVVLDAASGAISKQVT
jgi:uncharacterized protein (TIGR02996 family)